MRMSVIVHDAPQFAQPPKKIALARYEEKIFTHNSAMAQICNVVSLRKSCRRVVGKYK